MNIKKSEIILYVSVTIAGAFGLLLYIANVLNKPLIKTIQILMLNLYIPMHVNMFFGCEIKREESFLLYVYWFSLIVIGVFFIIRWLTGTKFFKKSYQSAVFAIMGTIFCAFLCAQIYSQFIFFFDEYKKYSGKSEYEKKYIRHGIIYEFSDFCQKKFPGRHRAKFITDIQKGGTEYYNVKMFLCYYLFPIDIMDFSEYPEDCYVVFCKNRPWPIPPDKIGKVFYYTDYSALVVKK